MTRRQKIEADAWRRYQIENWPALLAGNIRVAVQLHSREVAGSKWIHVPATNCH